MITCTLGNKKYSVEYISGRALRQIDDAAKMYAKIRAAGRAAAGEEAVQDNTTVQEALDVLVVWFCLLFNNQFTPDEVYDGYPADCLLHDVAFALLAVQTQTTAVLSDFPMKAAGTPKASA